MPSSRRPSVPSRPTRSLPPAPRRAATRPGRATRLASILLALAAAHAAAVGSGSAADPEGIAGRHDNPASASQAGSFESVLSVGGRGGDLRISEASLGGRGFSGGWVDATPESGARGLDVTAAAGGAGGGFGLSARYLVPSSGPRFWRWDLGLLSQPSRFVSLGFVFRDLAEEDVLAARQVLAAGIRPFGTPFLAASADAALAYAPWRGRAWREASWTTRLEVRPAGWLRLEAAADPEDLDGARLGLSLQLLPFQRSYFAAARRDGRLDWEYGGHYTHRPKSSYVRPPGRVIRYRIEGALPEEEWPIPFIAASTPSLHKVLRDLDEIESLRGIHAVAIEWKASGVQPASIEAVRASLDRIRGSGKRVVVWMQTMDMMGLYLASAADRVALHPGGIYRAYGMESEWLYLGRGLRRLGVEPQFVRVGRWKSAVEPFTLDSMSVEARQNMLSLLGDWHARVVRETAKARRLPEATVAGLVDSGSLLPRRAVAASLVDTLLHADELVEYAGGAGAREWTPAWVGIDREEWGPRPKIAVVVLSGEIVERRRRSLLSGKRGVEGDEVVRALDMATDDASIKGVVLRIASPGGSAVASADIWRAAMRLRASGKPFAVSVGSMAASGGYYAALPAERIYCQPGSILGSIGVFAGKLSIGPLLDTLGVRSERVGTGRFAGAESFFHPFDSLELARLQEYVDDFYAGFVERVREARSLDSAAVDSVAEGRIFTGAQATAAGLADSLGGLDHALDWVAARAGLGPRRSVQFVYPSLSGFPWPRGLDVLGPSISGYKIAQELVPDRWREAIAREGLDAWALGPWLPALP